MDSKRLKALESRLTPLQRKTALQLVQKELGEHEDGSKITYQDVADSVGISVRQLHRWKNENPIFTEYTGLLADNFLLSSRPEVYRHLMRAMRGAQPSVKAIDTYLKRFGLIQTKVQVENLEMNETRTDEALKQELDELDALLKDDLED